MKMRSRIFLVMLAGGFFFGFAYYAYHNYTFLEARRNLKEKQISWNDMEEKVNSTADRLGQKIDSGIKKTVIVLNLLGFTTSASCEGHLSWGLPYPWVDFEIRDSVIENLKNSLSIVMDLIKDEETRLNDLVKKMENRDNAADHTYLNGLYEKMHTLNEHIEQQARLRLLPLRNLIERFYTKHVPKFNTIIAMHEPELFRLHSIDGDWQIMRNETEKASKLQQYQEEMDKLTEFLVEYYFGNTN